jgi:preprotein translocase subunit SecG
MNILIWLLTAVHVLVALFLIVLVLMQKSQDQGVGAAFGGGMTESVFGAGTTTALVRMTIWCAAIMLGTTLLLAILHSRRSSSETLMEKALKNAPAATAPAASQAPAFPGIVAPPAPASQPVEKPAETPAATPAASEKKP